MRMDLKVAATTCLALLTLSTTPVTAGGVTISEITRPIKSEGGSTVDIEGLITSVKRRLNEQQTTSSQNTADRRQPRPSTSPQIQ